MVKIVTAAILRDQQGRVFLCRRAPGQKNAGDWEFPGGKLEEGESLPQGLERELREELGIETRAGKVIAESEYHYGHGAIRLVALETEWLSGEMHPIVHDQLEWVEPSRLAAYALSPADVPIAKFIHSMAGMDRCGSEEPR